jgi:tetratricopeptide (TPR) repeat protein
MIKENDPPLGYRRMISTKSLVLVSIISVLIFHFPFPASCEDKKDPLPLFKSGKYSEAAEAAMNSIAANPSDMEAYVLLCKSLLAMERFQEALAYGKKAHAIAKYDIRPMEICGEAYFRLGKNEEALKSFQDFIVLAPEGTKVGPVYFLMGEIYIRLGMYQHADIAFTTTVQYDANDAKAWSRLGYAREQSGDLRYAKQAYDAALGINPRLSDAILGYERVKKSLKN